MKKMIVFLFAATSLVACNKDEHDAAIIPVNNAPKYKIVDFKSQPETYGYDQYGRQIRLVSFDGSRVETSYGKGVVTRLQYNSSGALYRTTIIELNADGLQARTYYKDSPQNYSLYEYGPGKKVTKLTSVYNGEITVSTYFHNNDVVDSIQYVKNGARYLANLYTYYLDQPNVMKGQNAGILYYGEPSKYMMKSQVHVNANGTSVPEQYSYGYDGMGRMISLTEVSNSGTSTGYYTYY